MGYNWFGKILLLILNYLILVIGLLPIIIYDHIYFKIECKDAYEKAVNGDGEMNKREIFLIDTLSVLLAAITWPQWLYGFCVRRII